MKLAPGAARSFDPKAHLAGEQVHHQKVRHAARHTDNQRADAAYPELVPIFLNHAKTVQYRICLRSNGTSRGQERSTRKQLRLQKRQSLLLIPFNERLGLGKAGSVQELGECAIMKGAILANIQYRTMKSKNIH